MNTILAIGDGNFLFGLFTAIFAINGIILVLRGAILLLEEVAESFNFNKDWKIGIFGVVNLLSYVGLLIAITRIPSLN